MITAPRRFLALSGLLAIGAFVGMALLGDRTPMTLLLSLAASLAAGLTVILVIERPVFAFGLLFILASISDIVIPLSVGRVRLEQPSIIAALIALAVGTPWPRPLIRHILPIVLCFFAYLVVLIVASAVHAPEPLVSARMIIWTTLSMGGGLVAFWLLVGWDDHRVGDWFVGTGVAHALLGLLVAGAFLVAGPFGIPGMQTSPGEVPKVTGLAFEANLFASMLGALAPFALNRFWIRPGLTRAIPLILIVVGVGLGVTRGAYLGLGAGFLAYLAVLMYRAARPARVLGMVPTIAVAILLAPLVAATALPVERPSGGETPSFGQSPSPSGTRGPSLGPAPSRGASPATTSGRGPAVDTFAYRLNQVPVALRDLERSPIIGLGAATYGQFHEHRDELAGTPDYLGMLALVAIYESGVLGAAALTLGFVLSLALLFRLSRLRPGMGAAYIASIVSLLVAYQATNALFFSITWMILGAGLALAARTVGTGAARAP